MIHSIAIGAVAITAVIASTGVAHGDPNPLPRPVPIPATDAPIDAFYLIPLWVTQTGPGFGRVVQVGGIPPTFNSK